MSRFLARLPIIGDAVTLGKWCPHGHCVYGKLAASACPRCDAGEAPARAYDALTCPAGHERVWARRLSACWSCQRAKLHSDPARHAERNRKALAHWHGRRTRAA